MKTFIQPKAQPVEVKQSTLKTSVNQVKNALVMFNGVIMSLTSALEYDKH